MRASFAIVIGYLGLAACAKVDRDPPRPQPLPLVIETPAPPVPPVPADDAPPGEVPTTILSVKRSPPPPKRPPPDPLRHEPSEPVGRGKLDDRSASLAARDLDIGGADALGDLVPEPKNAFSARRRPR